MYCLTAVLLKWVGREVIRGWLVQWAVAGGLVGFAPFMLPSYCVPDYDRTYYCCNAELPRGSTVVLPVTYFMLYCNILQIKLHSSCQIN